MILRPAAHTCTLLRQRSGLLALLLACCVPPAVANETVEHGPVVPKVAVAPAPGALAPVKAKVATDPVAKDAAPKTAKAEPATDEALKKMLIERINGAGEVVLKPSDVVAKAATKSASKPAPKLAANNDDPAARRAAEYRAAKGEAHTGPAHWAYKGEGAPEAWGRLNPENSLCSAGRRQSPIDIRDGLKVQLEPVKFDYQPSGFRVLDTGHTIQVNVGAGNSIEVMGRRFELLQFHFHKPSEERINGRQSDMVAHLVHKDGNGRLAVVAVLLTRGAPQPVVQSVWNNLPLERSEDFAAAVPIDLNQLLPEDRRYYTYMGSLTTPPCSEDVLWMVMKAPVPVSAEQIAIFARLYPMNARPPQPSNDRVIKESN